MRKAEPKGYSGTQIMLHWAIAGLVVIQFLINQGMEESFTAFMRGGTVPAETLRMANLHAISGGAIFVLALWRLWLRFTRGVPALPAEEPTATRLLARATHALFYALLIGMPVAGAAAWYLGIAGAGRAHGLAAYLLLGLIGLHLAGVLVQFFVFKSGVPGRILIADEERG